MGLFYLLTLYCFVRSTDETGERQQAKRRRGRKPELTKQRLPSALWPLASGLLASISSCRPRCIALGKGDDRDNPRQVLVLLYDRTFVAGSFREAWRLRWRYYLGLVLVWLLLAGLMIDLKQRGAGFNEGVSWWNYGLTSCRAVALYLKLAIWPHPLVFDYGSKAIIVQHAYGRDRAAGADSGRMLGRHGDCALAPAGGGICRRVVFCDSLPDVQRGSGGIPTDRGIPACMLCAGLRGCLWSYWAWMV